MRKDGESKTYHENEEWLPIFSVEELYKSLEKNIPKLMPQKKYKYNGKTVKMIS